MTAVSFTLFSLGGLLLSLLAWQAELRRSSERLLQKAETLRQRGGDHLAGLRRLQWHWEKNHG
jgi:hypothetical protein